MNNKETKIRNRKYKITVIVAISLTLIMAVTCSWATIQSMYWAIYMIAMDVTGNAYDFPSFGNMPKFLLGTSAICFVATMFLIKIIIEELIHTTKRSTMEEDNKNNLDELLDCTRNKRGGVTIIGECAEDKN